MNKMLTKAGISTLCSALLISPGTGLAETDGYLPSSDRAYPEQVLWGDQHVHTALSGDAGAAGTTVMPEDAVRFARGHSVKSNTGQEAKLHRALDWVAVTDHSDGLGVIGEILTGNPAMLTDPTVKRWHKMIQKGADSRYQATREIISAQASKSLPGVMMDSKWMTSAWQDSVEVMEQYNEPGTFTTLIGFEWTSNGEVGQNLHRNVIFRDGADRTRDLVPLTTFESSVPGRAGTDPESLWHWLAEYEKNTGGRVLAIPHNGNMSNGWMFREARYDGTPLTPEWAEARARWEVLLEIFQYKGAGEAHPALSPLDEFADYEIWDTSDLGGNAKPEGAIAREYAREALKRGMALESELGTNPFKFGVVSGTDTHTGLSTGGEEDNYWGKFPAGEPGPERWKRVYKNEENYKRRDWTLGAAGITGVWASANTREAIWDAMQRREVYASSGPRITLRFFAGYGFQQSDAAQEDIASAGYATGVPMGADLPVDGQGRAPAFLLAAAKDPDGGNLDRVQIVKGWIDARGEIHERIYNVAWSGERELDDKGRLPPVGNTVNVERASYTNSIGAPQLTAYFRDPDFDPMQKAFYYARVIEIPTPRWTAYDAARFNVAMAPEVPMTLQERVVSSPIWYQ